MSNKTHYYNDQSFRNTFGNNTNLSMFHMNIRSIPDHFLDLTTLLNNLNIELKMIAIPETWIKSFHIHYKNLMWISAPTLGIPVC